MPSLWIYRAHVIIPEADQAAANIMAADIHPDFAGSFMDANASAGGTFPPTHIFVNSALKQDMQTVLAAALPNWASYGLLSEPQYWLMLAETGELLSSNVSAADARQTDPNTGEIIQPGAIWGGVDSANTLKAAGLAWTIFPEDE